MIYLKVYGSLRKKMFLKLAPQQYLKRSTNVYLYTYIHYCKLYIYYYVCYKCDIVLNFVYINKNVLINKNKLNMHIIYILCILLNFDGFLKLIFQNVVRKGLCDWQERF